MHSVGDRVKTIKAGYIVVIKVESQKRILVRFEGTGYEVWTTDSHLAKGCVKDRLFKSVLGIGFIGDGDFSSSDHAYRIWNGIMSRCYNENRRYASPTYSNVTVCEDWHNFQNFAKWYYENKPNDGVRYDIDKDMLSKGNKVYSPETCRFVTRKENINIANAKKIKLMSPSGDTLEFKSIVEAANKHGLDESCISRLINGKYKTHKGWRKAE